MLSGTYREREKNETLESFDEGVARNDYVSAS